LMVSQDNVYLIPNCNIYILGTKIYKNNKFPFFLREEKRREVFISFILKMSRLVYQNMNLNYM
jgi:hypothetical protein